MRVPRPTSLFVMCALCASAPSWAASYYVDGITGNDGNDGTEASPWRTIGEANRSLSAGDTVYLRGGAYYGDYINPSRSGASDSTRITYRNYNHEVVVVMDATYGVRINGQSFVTVDGIHFSNLDHHLYVESGSHNTISNCTFDGMRTYTWHGSVVWRNSQYNWIHHNTFARWGRMSSGDEGSLFEVGLWSSTNDYSDNNLIEDNVLYAGGHHLFGVASSFNVIRNNYFHHEAWTACARGECGNRSVITEGYRAGFNLYEGNIFAFASLPPDDNGASGITVSSPNNIIRMNVFYDNEASGVEISNQSPFANADANHIYSNVFYRNGYNQLIPSAYRVGLYFANWNGATRGNAVKNNIFHQNQSGAIQYGSSSPSEQAVEGNWLEQGDPQFMDVFSNPDPSVRDLYDFRLQPSSPAIDAGVFLTTTTSSGSGITIPVADPYYFTDGWDLVPGDRIQLEGQTQVVRVVDVEYNNRTIVVDASVTWTTGQGVGLHYSGSAPDMGAYEHEQATPPPSVPGDRIEAETGTLSIPMRILSAADASGGAYIQTAEGNSGTASYTIQVAETGTYKIVAGVSTADGASDSFFVSIDNGAEDTWDMNPGGQPGTSNVWREVAMALRGTGTALEPEYNPYLFVLTQGSHVITFRGREANAKLDYFYVQAVVSDRPNQPSNLRVILQ